MSDPQDQEILHDAYDRFLEARFRGEKLDPAAVCPDRPNLREEIVAAWRMAEDVAGSSSGSAAPQIADYRILEEIGHGGMGTVYLAHQTRLDRRVALKVLPRSIALSRRARARFLEEARDLARVEHENIVAIHDVFEDGEVLCYAMELVEGLSLRRLLDGARRAGRPRIASIAAQLDTTPEALGVQTPLQLWLRTGIAIARALQAAHDKGIVHRDVKPGNVLIRRDGRPLLVDFGLAQHTGGPLSTTTGFVGTPIYAPPEQLRASEEPPESAADTVLVDCRADVYGLGATLYEACAGRPPFRGHTTAAVLRRIASGGAEPLRKVAPDVPRDLRIVLEKAMDPDRERRYATAAEFADDLERVVNLEPIHARRVRMATRLLRYGRRNRRALGSAALGAAVMLVISAAWWLKRESDQRLPERVAALVRAARGVLLEPAVRRATWLDRERGEATPRAFARAQERRKIALKRYDQALALMPGHRLATERAALGLVLRLPELVGTGLSRERVQREFPALGWVHPAVLRALQRPIPAISKSAVRPRMIRSVHTGSAGDLSGVARTQFVVGLLGFLAGDPLMCEDAWRSLDSVAHGTPMIDVALAQAYQADGRPGLALPRLQHAVEAVPDAPHLRLDLASVALELQNVRMAQMLLDGVEQPVRRSDRFALLDAWSKELVRPDVARRVYERMLQRQPAARMPRFRLAMLELRRGDVAAAVVHLREILRMHPHDCVTRKLLAGAALRLGDTEVYLEQARYVLASDFGHYRSRGVVRDLLDILRMGGLQAIYRLGVATVAQHGSPGVLGVPDSFWAHAEGCASRPDVEAMLLREAGR